VIPDLIQYRVYKVKAKSQPAIVWEHDGWVGTFTYLEDAIGQIKKLIADELKTINKGEK